MAKLPLWLNREKITIYFSVPAVFRQFVGTIGEQEQFPCLRIRQLGSDLVTPRELEDFQKHFSTETILILRFGTTETGTLRRIFFTVNSCVDAAAVPVGYATEDTDITLLDEDGKDVQFGAVGEIVVESRYVSPGYGGSLILLENSFSPTQTAVTNLFFTPATWVGCAPMDCYTTWAEKTSS